MHDTTDLESRGIPAIFIATREFVDAARAQAAGLGADPAGVFVDHPIQDRTDDEMRVLAAAALEQVVTALVEDA